MYILFNILLSEIITLFYHAFLTMHDEDWWPPPAQTHSTFFSTIAVETSTVFLLCWPEMLFRSVSRTGNLKVVVLTWWTNSSCCILCEKIIGSSWQFSFVFDQGAKEYFERCFFFRVFDDKRLIFVEVSRVSDTLNNSDRQWNIYKLFFWFWYMAKSKDTITREMRHLCKEILYTMHCQVNDSGSTSKIRSNSTKPFCIIAAMISWESHDL